MNTDSRRKAAATFAAKRKADGWAKVTIWLSPAAQSRLATLTTEHGSRDAALNALLAETPPAKPPRPVPATTPAPKARKTAPGASAGARKPRGFDATTGEPIY